MSEPPKVHRRSFLSAGAATALAFERSAVGQKADAVQQKASPDDLSSVLFPPLPEQPRREGMLEVSKEPPHSIYWAEYGNPKGEPILYVHGGPGADITAAHLRMMDPEHYRIIAFNQRGSGKSTFGKEHITGKELAEKLVKGENVDHLIKEMLDGNTTPDLVEDIVKLRKHLGIEHQKMHMFGGSWGSCLSLAYAIEHPDTVKSMTLRGIYLGRKADNDWSYQGNAACPNDKSKAGAWELYPEQWRNFVEGVPEKERGDMFAAYKKLLTDPDPKVRAAASVRFQCWEEATSRLDYVPPEQMKFNDAIKAIPATLLELHYFDKECFMPKDHIINNLEKIKDIPINIVQGRFDATCPLFIAMDLINGLEKANPQKRPEVAIVTAGHYAQQPQIAKGLVRATNMFKEWDRSGLPWERFRQLQEQRVGISASAGNVR